MSAPKTSQVSTLAALSDAVVVLIDEFIFLSKSL
jgi:hypothetical protein